MIRRLAFRLHYLLTLFAHGISADVNITFADNLRSVGNRYSQEFVCEEATDHACEIHIHLLQY